MRRVVVVAAVVRPLSASLLLLLTGLATNAQAAATRIVTLSPHLAEMVCAVGACAQLVGVSARSDYPPEVAKRPQVGDGFAINAEAVLLLKPDLVLAWDGGTPQAAVARLRGLGLNVQAIKVRQLDEVEAALARVGALTGHEHEAAEVAAKFHSDLAERRARHAHDAPIRVVYQIETAPAYTIGRESPISAALAICGGVNVFADLGRIAGSVSAEAMLAAAPEAVLYGGEENAEAIRRYWARLSGTPAMRFGNLDSINADLLGRAGPRMIEGIDNVCDALDRARGRRAGAVR
jgi:ABC-type hemin transport system substrate-binding protein